MGAETSTPTAGTGEEVEVDEFMEQVIKLLQDPIDFQQSRPGVTTGRPYPDPLQQDRLHQPPPTAVRGVPTEIVGGASGLVKDRQVQG